MFIFRATVSAVSCLVVFICIHLLCSCYSKLNDDDDDDDDIAYKQTAKNYHICNNHRQHTARLFQTTPYDRLSLNNSWASFAFYFRFSAQYVLLII